MKAVTIYYSYSGKCRKAAEEIARKRNTDLVEVRDKKRPGTVKAYTAGCYRALRSMTGDIAEESWNLEQYDRIIVVGPVWAGKPAPPVNNVIQKLPARKKVEIVMVSGSGSSKAEPDLNKRIRDKGSAMVKFTDMKG